MDATITKPTLATIKRDQVYPLLILCDLFGWTRSKCWAWKRAKKLRLTADGRLLGTEIHRLAGPAAADLFPTLTVQQRIKRDDAAIAAARAKHRQKGST